MAAFNFRFYLLFNHLQGASSASDLRRSITAIVESRNRIGADQDPDGLLLMFRAKMLLELDYEALAFLNLVRTHACPVLPCILVITFLT